VTKFRGNPWAILIVVSLGFFMTLLGKTFPGAHTFDRRYRSSWPCWQVLNGEEKL
jgi:hypothetical protein